jgi:hypothetical protein
MNTFLEFAIVGAWVYVSVMALTRVFTERRRWQQQISRQSASVSSGSHIACMHMSKSHGRVDRIKR